MFLSLATVLSAIFQQNFYLATVSGFESVSESELFSDLVLYSDPAKFFRYEFTTLNGTSDTDPDTGSGIFYILGPGSGSGMIRFPDPRLRIPDQAYFLCEIILNFIQNPFLICSYLLGPLNLAPGICR
jgi:hypothetical protein